MLLMLGFYAEARFQSRVFVYIKIKHRFDVESKRWVKSERTCGAIFIERRACVRGDRGLDFLICRVVRFLERGV